MQVGAGVGVAAVSALPDSFSAGAHIYKRECYFRCVPCGHLFKRHLTELEHPDRVTGVDCPRCESMELRVRTVGKLRPTWRYRTAVFQQAVRESGLTLEELGRVAGMESGYVSRVLGLRPHGPSSRRSSTGKRYPGRCSVSMSYENAKRLAVALGLDLVEWEI